VKDLVPLRKEIKSIQDNFDKADSFAGRLAGHLQREYVITKSKSHMEKLIFPLVEAYEAEYPAYKKKFMRSFSSEPSVTLSNIWVNFQKKTEFNPIHTHNGMYSFVIWMNIPYDIEEEKKVFPQFNKDDKQDEMKTSCFEFVYSNSLGEISQFSIHVDKTFENNCILFPATMAHQVYPFYTSDDYRISVSGNFTLNV
jgi:hypothetical protein